MDDKVINIFIGYNYNLKKILKVTYSNHHPEYFILFGHSTMYEQLDISYVVKNKKYCVWDKSLIACVMLVYIDDLNLNLRFEHSSDDAENIPLGKWKNKKFNDEIFVEQIYDSDECCNNKPAKYK